MTPRVLVAGIGNVFLGDDGFGVEVVRALAESPLPPDVRVADYGISGMHLAYDLLDGYPILILVDATPRGGTPGTLYVLDVDPDAVGHSPVVDGHGMQPDAVLALLRTLGGRAGRVLVVGCEPATVDEGIGLSAPVAAAVDGAVRQVRRLLDEDAKTSTTPGQRRHRAPAGESRARW